MDSRSVKLAALDRALKAMFTEAGLRTPPELFRMLDRLEMAKRKKAAA